jgi:hypothetical protein
MGGGFIMTIPIRHILPPSSLFLHPPPSAFLGSTDLRVSRELRFWVSVAFGLHLSFHQCSCIFPGVLVRRR